MPTEFDGLPPQRPSSAAEYRARVAAAWKMDPFTAHDIAAEGLRYFPDDLLLRQKQAHALARTGSLTRAGELLEKLYRAGHRDPETMGLLGRVWKDRAAHEPDPERRLEATREARRYYAEGLAAAEGEENTEGYYPGINAAALSVRLGETERAVDFAQRAEALLAQRPERDYWSVATLAEAALIRRDLAQARALYKEAVETFAPAADQCATTRRQARWLAETLFGDATALEDCFRVPPVVLFIGHLTDAPGRAEPRFPEHMVEEVKRAIQQAVQAYPGCIGYAGAARGGDLLFLECLQEAGWETQVVLALEKDAYRQVSVDTSAEPEWAARYERALAGATAVRIANRHSSHADPLAFEYATRQLIGLACLRARQLETELKAIVFWDGAPGDDQGGTAWAVEHLRRLGVPVVNVHPRQRRVAELPRSAPLPQPGDEVRAIRAMLFSDCKGYSKLREEEVVSYTRQFLAGVAHLIQASAAPPIAANTWGDGLYLVFRQVGDAARFALQLRDAATHRAEELDLPAGVCLRIALHAGPVSPLHDPVTDRQNFVGVNVAFAARIEPITAENQVYTSEPFACLCADAGLHEFAFEYLGSTAFAKGYGTLPLYQLLRVEGT